MTFCPRGHPSTDEEYCEVCGAAMAGAPLPGPAPPAGGGWAEPERCPVCSTPRDARYCENCRYDFFAGVPSGDTTGHTTRPVAPEAREGPPEWGADGTPWTTGAPRGNTTGSNTAAGTTGGDTPAGGTTGGAGDGTPGGSGAPPALTAVVGADRAYFDRVIAEGGPDAPRVTFPPYCPERTFPLGDREVRIGRHSRSRDARPEIDLSEPPKDPGVSHLHAVLLPQADGGWAVVDPGSANGTLVNGRPLETNVPVRVAAGDRIHLGAWTAITLSEPGATEKGGAP